MTRNWQFVQSVCRVRGACLHTGFHRESTPKRAALQLCRQGRPFFLEKSKRDRGGDSEVNRKEAPLCLQSCTSCKPAREG